MAEAPAIILMVYRIARVKTMFDQKRYTFLDIEWDGTPKTVIPDYTVEEYYEMVEGEIDG